MNQITFLKRFVRRFFILAFIIVMIDSGVVDAATYFVAVTGNDSENGSETSLFGQLKKE